MWAEPAGLSALPGPPQNPAVAPAPDPAPPRLHGDPRDLKFALGFILALTLRDFDQLVLSQSG